MRRRVCVGGSKQHVHKKTPHHTRARPSKEFSFSKFQQQFPSLTTHTYTHMRRTTTTDHNGSRFVWIREVCGGGGTHIGYGTSPTSKRCAERDGDILYVQ